MFCIMQLFHYHCIEQTTNTMKDQILQLLNKEIENATFSYILGKRNFNEIYTDSLLIEFDFDGDEMFDIRISMQLGDPTQTIVYACDLSDEQVISILQAAQFEECASDMDIEI